MRDAVGIRDNADVAVGDSIAINGCCLTIEAPDELARFIATKGSIAVRRVSLTVNGVEGSRFQVNLIPPTLAMTTLGALNAGARMNLEMDLVAR